MKIKNIALLVTLSALFFSACAKYETQYEGPYKDGQTITSEPVVYEIVYVQEGVIFMASADLKHVKQLATPQLVDKASINFAHTRIAYRPTFGGNLVVIDTAGTQIETVPYSSNVTDFDWHSNNQTLFMLEDPYVKQYGPNIPIAYDYLDAAHPYSGTSYYYSLTVLPQGDLAFGFGVSGFGGTQYLGYRIAYKTPGPGRVDHDLPVSGQYPGLIRSSEDGQKLFVIAGTDAGTFNTITYTPLATIANSSLGAMSPDGQKFVFWDNSNVLFLNDNQGSANIGYGNVTDIDW